MKLQPPETVDYSTWKKGKRIDMDSVRGLVQIGVCPVCGRKGIVYKPYRDAKGIYKPGYVKHSLTYRKLTQNVVEQISSETCKIEVTAAQANENEITDRSNKIAHKRRMIAGLQTEIAVLEGELEQLTSVEQGRKVGIVE